MAGEEAALASLLPELVSRDGSFWGFGQGLLSGTSDAAKLWDRLISEFTLTEEELRNPMVLRGFVSALHAKDPELADALLDDSLEHETLSSWYPLLQVAFPLEYRDVARLKRSVAVGKTPAHKFRFLADGRATDPILPSDLKELLLMIAEMQAGHDVAAEILHMRLYSDKERKKSIAPDLVDAGCELLRQLSFETATDREDRRFGGLAKDCLKGERGAAVTSTLCARLKSAVATNATHSWHHDDLLEGMLTVPPYATLDGLCGGDNEELDRGIRILCDAGIRKTPLTAVTEVDLLRWCAAEPETRYSALAAVVTTTENVQGKPPRWASLALRFLESAPEPAIVLREFVRRFMPSGVWSGSLATILESNATLLATEMIRAAWRLRRCGIVEAGLAETPEQNEASLRIQNAVDRARAQANSIFRRAHNDLRRLQAEQPTFIHTLPAAPRRAHAAGSSIGFEFAAPAAPPPQAPIQNQPNRSPKGTPMRSLFMTMLDYIDVHPESIGNSTGKPEHPVGLS